MKQKKTVEDYLKTIYILQCRNGIVRGSDIAQEQNVSRPTVSIALKDLEQEGYLFTDEAHEIHLTTESRLSYQFKDETSYINKALYA